MPADSALADYKTKLERVCGAIESAHASQTFALILFWAATGLSVLLFFNSTQRGVPLWSGALPLPAVVIAALWYRNSRRRWSRSLRLRNFYDSGIARMEDRWHENSFAGDEFRVANHVYDSDLRILGEGSLFERICTARTGIGRSRLAEYLLNPCELGEAIRRQDAVRELKPRGLTCVSGLPCSDDSISRNPHGACSPNGCNYPSLPRQHRSAPSRSQVPPHSPS